MIGVAGAGQESPLARSSWQQGASGKELLSEVFLVQVIYELLIFHYSLFIDWSEFVSFLYQAAKAVGVPRLVDDYMAKKLMVDEFVSHDVPYEKINEAFHLMHFGQSVRTVVHFKLPKL